VTASTYEYTVTDAGITPRTSQFLENRLTAHRGLILHGQQRLMGCLPSRSVLQVVLAFPAPDARSRACPQGTRYRHNGLRLADTSSDPRSGPGGGDVADLGVNSGNIQENNRRRISSSTRFRVSTSPEGRPANVGETPSNDRCRARLKGVFRFRVETGVLRDLARKDRPRGLISGL
jgi:hypothetical protein